MAELLDRERELRAVEALTADSAAGEARIALIEGAAGIGKTRRSFAALHGRWLAVNLTDDGPLALIVDDLHWCDRASLRFLAYLAHRLEGLAVLVAASLRPAEPGADPALMAELAGDPVSTTLRPAPLGEDAVGALVRARLGEQADAEFVAACANASAATRSSSASCCARSRPRGSRRSTARWPWCGNWGRARPPGRCCCASRACRPTRWRWPGRRRCWATAPTSERWRARRRR